MFKDLPKILTLAILLIKAIDIRETPRIIQGITYLWREFGIKTKVTPVVKEYKISFYYKDEQLCRTKIVDLKEMLKIIDDIKNMRGHQD